MKLVLTRKSDNVEIIVDSDMVKLMEPEIDGAGTHIVFGPDLVRVVNEGMASIAAAIGVTTPKAVAHLTAMAVAIAKKSSKK